LQFVYIFRSFFTHEKNQDNGEITSINQAIKHFTFNAHVLIQMYSKALLHLSEVLTLSEM